MTTTGELSYDDDDDWVFDFFRFGTESVLGFFFVFFWYRVYIELSILLLLFFGMF